MPAHASLLTGKYPARHGADYDPKGNAVLGDVIRLPVARLMRAGKLADDSTTLAELMAERGYATGAFVAGPWLHRSFELLQGFARKDDKVDTFGGRPAAEITGAALAWLDGLEPERPYFLFANYFDPRAPYEPIGRYPEFPRATEPLDFDYAAFMRGTEKFGTTTAPCCAIAMTPRSETWIMSWVCCSLRSARGSAAIARAARSGVPRI